MWRKDVGEFLSETINQNFPLLLRRYHELVSAFILQLALFPAAQATFTYRRGSNHQYICITEDEEKAEDV